MRVVCYGINHEKASVATREKITFTESDLKEALQSLASLNGISESVILSTCNRVEIYAAAEEGSRTDQLISSVQGWLQERFTLLPDDLDAFYQNEHRDSVKHLFAVASGLNSMVLGETEIFGQVKKAYAAAQSAGTTSKTLNRLFQRSFLVGKQVRTKTQITRGSTSVGAVGVELAEKIFGNLKKCQILLIGAGEISRRTAQSLQSRGAKAIIVSNRSFDKAQELAESIGGSAIRFDEWDSELKKVDIIISSTSAPHPVVTREKLEPSMRSRKGRPLFMIDLSVPRDVASDVKELEGVYVHDLDVLQQLAEHGKAKRRQQLNLCYQMIDEHVEAILNEGSSAPPSSTASNEADPLTS